MDFLIVLACFWVIGLCSAGLYIGIMGIRSTYKLDKTIQEMSDRWENIVAKKK